MLKEYTITYICGMTYLPLLFSFLKDRKVVKNVTMVENGCATVA